MNDKTSSRSRVPLDPQKVARGILIPDALLSSSKITPSAKLVWGRLFQIWKAGETWPKIEALALSCGLSMRHAVRLLDELEARKLIVREAPDGRDRLAHRPSTYVLLQHPDVTRTSQNDAPESDILSSPEMTKCHVGNARKRAGEGEIRSVTAVIRSRYGKNGTKNNVVHDVGGEKKLTSTAPEIRQAVLYISASFKERTGGDPPGLSGQLDRIISAARIYQPAGLMALWDVWMKRDGRRPRWNRDVRHPWAAFLASLDRLADDPSWKYERKNHQEILDSILAGEGMGLPGAL